MRVAIIPARGGSKRIPRKNIREFAGKPMIAHSIECALQSGVFDRVIVSTDDEEIAGVARESGAETPFVRPAEISDDYSGTTEVVRHAIKWLQMREDRLTAVCCIYATAPFMRQADIKKALVILETGRWRYVFSATSFSYPIFRAFQRNAAGGLEMFFPEFFNARSQDLPVALHDAGQFYWGTPQAWLSEERVFGASSTVVQIPRWRVQDIDTEEDWIRAESMAAYLNARESSNS